MNVPFSINPVVALKLSPTATWQDALKAFDIPMPKDASMHSRDRMVNTETRPVYAWRDTENDRIQKWKDAEKATRPEIVEWTVRTSLACQEYFARVKEERAELTSQYEFCGGGRGYRLPEWRSSRGETDEQFRAGIVDAQKRWFEERPASAKEIDAEVDRLMEQTEKILDATIAPAMLRMAEMDRWQGAKKIADNGSW